MFIWPFLHFASFLIHSIILFLIIFVNRKSLLSFFCASLVGCFALWSLSLVFVQAPLPRETAVFWNNFGALGWIGFCPFFLFISQNITGTENKLKTVIIDTVIVSFGIALFIAQLYDKLNPLAPEFVPGIGWSCILTTNGFYAFVIYYMCTMIYSIFLLFNYSKKETQKRKKFQAEQIAFSAGLTVILSFLANSMPLWLHSTEYPDLTDIFTLIWSVSLVNAIYKYKFLKLNPANTAENILRTMNEAVFIVDNKNKIVQCNDSACIITGFNKENLLQQSITTLLKFDENNITCFSDFKNRSGKYLSTKGKVITLSISCSVFKDEFGDALGFILTVNDITELKETESLLRKNEQLLDRMSSSSPFAYYVVNNITDEILYLNQQFIDLWNLKEIEAQIKNRTVKNRTVAEKSSELIDLSNIDMNMHLNLQNPDFIKTVEDEMRLKDGRSVRLYSSAVLTESNQYLGRFFLYENISDRKKIEEKLVLAKNEAEEAYKAKSKFIATMSHEIRTPISAIISTAALLAESSVSEETKKYGEIIQSSAESLLETINDILNYSKIEAGKVELEMIQFDLHKLIDDLVVSMATQAYKKEIELNYYIEPDVPRQLTGDLMHLRQILTNLAGNGIKFTDKGDVLITVSTESVNGDKVVIRFSVLDTGIGIPEAMQKKLFSSFTQADITISRKYGGTGLGLTICKELVNLMGGNIGMSSKEGDGSIFWFTVELCKVSEEIKTDSQIDNTNSLEGIKCLSCVESPITWRIVDKYLNLKGCNNKKCNDLNEIYSLIENGKRNSELYQVLLIDRKITGKNNCQIIQEIRRKVDPGKIKVIELKPIGYLLNEHDTENCFDGYITKPIRNHIFIESIEKILKQKNLSFESKFPEKVNKEKSDKGNFRILVVEDNQINQKIALVILKKIGFPCDIVSGGKDAISAVTQKKYDLIFMDCHMPEMDGFQTTVQIRMSGCNSPIVAMTADSQEDVIEQCNLSGMNGFLAKPITIQSVSETVEKWSSISNRNIVGKNEKEQTKISNGNEHIEIDENALMERIGGDKELIPTLFRVYTNDSDKLIQRLETALRSSTIQDTKEILHTLKGASLNICAVRFSIIVTEMYTAAKNTDYDKVRKMYPELIAGWVDLKAFMDNYKR